MALQAASQSPDPKKNSGLGFGYALVRFDTPFRGKLEPEIEPHERKWRQNGSVFSQFVPDFVI
jgi:hypothetical protein